MPKKWIIALSTSAGAFLIAWVMFEAVLRLPRDVSLTFAGAALTLVLAPFTLWAAKESAAPRTRVLLAAATLLLLALTVAGPLLAQKPPGPSASAAPGQQSPGQAGTSAAATHTPLSGMLAPAPQRSNAVLAGATSTAMVYTLFPKGCSQSSLKPTAPLAGKFSEVKATLALDDRTDPGVRTNVVLIVDGVKQEPRILSVTQGTSYVLDVRGKQELALELATMGQSPSGCADAGYAVTISGNALS